MGHCKGYHTLTPVTAAAGLHGPQKGNHRPRLEGSYRPPRPGEVRCRSRGAPSWGSICKACLICAAAKVWPGLARHAGRDQHCVQGCTTACAPAAPHRLYVLAVLCGWPYMLQQTAHSSRCALLL